MSFLVFIFAVAAFFKHFPEAASFLLNLNFAIWMIILITWGVMEFGWNFWTISGVVILIFGLFNK